MVDANRTLLLSKMALPTDADITLGRTGLTAAAETMDDEAIEGLGCAPKGRRRPFLVAFAHPAPGEVLGRTRITRAIETSDDPS
jgi:hypothetical protein